MKKIALVILAVLMVGCSRKEAVTAAQPEFDYKKYHTEQATSIVGSLTYVKDPRADICYAHNPSANANYGSNTLMVVPCEKVEHLISK